MFLSFQMKCLQTMRYIVCYSINTTLLKMYAFYGMFRHGPQQDKYLNRYMRYHFIKSRALFYIQNDPYGENNKNSAQHLSDQNSASRVKQAF